MSAAAPVARREPRWGLAAGGVLLVGFITLVLSHLTLLDHDLFHEMALIRETVRSGHLPREDVFAYTPTVRPCVHHEWGTGLVFYGVTRAAGAAGLLALKYMLVAAMGGLIVWHWRRDRLAWIVCAAVTPLGVVLMSIALGTVRAELFTLTFAAGLLVMLQSDRAGRRGWIGIWLLVYVVWLNMHGGFVVGAGLIALHWVEQAMRGRRMQWHLLIVAGAMAGLVFVNPYGGDYPRYLWRAITLPRTQIAEWNPVWRGPAIHGVLFVFSLMMVIYVMARVGPRRMGGVLIVLVCAAMTIWHVRHMPVYGLAWTCFMPGWMEMTPLGEALRESWSRRRRAYATAAAIIGVACCVLAAMNAPWKLRIPTRWDGREENPLIYPAGAVEYLRSERFSGNLMTPFSGSAYISWHLHPAVKIAMDSRFEVAYSPSLLDEINGLYSAKPGWQSVLTRYPTDLVLVPRWRELAKRMPACGGWRCVYRDDSYEIYARDGIALPDVDRRGQTIGAEFP